VKSLYQIETAMSVVKEKGQKRVRKRVCPLKNKRRDRIWGLVRN